MGLGVWVYDLGRIGAAMVAGLGLKVGVLVLSKNACLILPG